MSKDGGQQASYGIPYEILPSVTLHKSEKPTEKTIKRIQDQSQLRLDIKKYNPGIFFLFQSYIVAFIILCQPSNPSTLLSCKDFCLRLLRNNM
jgi:hypothetical protein